MIEVSHLTKKYSSSARPAVNDLSFTIGDGAIYGFLGPNGAGKTTTMNIITGCLGATEGTVTVGGHDIFDEPIAAKKLIGYLPEQPPLYTDMTPYEYLTFVARAKGVPRGKVAPEVEGACRRTHIVEMAFRQIRNLSKGYRQRVGIAQAILGDPRVVILDEPTVGLDPVQVIEIRELIRSLGRDRTVIFSSHILSEVQAVCDSMMIIDHGSLVASGTMQELEASLAGTGTVTLEAAAGPEKVREAMAGIGGIRSLEVTAGQGGTSRACAVSDSSVDLRMDISQALTRHGIAILTLSRSVSSLEDLFIGITKNEERKGDA